MREHSLKMRARETEVERETESERVPAHGPTMTMTTTLTLSQLKKYSLIKLWSEKKRKAQQHKLCSALHQHRSKRRTARGWRITRIIVIIFVLWAKRTEERIMNTEKNVQKKYFSSLLLLLIFFFTSIQKTKIYTYYWEALESGSLFYFKLIAYMMSVRVFVCYGIVFVLVECARVAYNHRCF